MKTQGNRKVILASIYLVGLLLVTALEIWKHDNPNLLGMAGMATGLATGLGTFMWGNAKEHEHEAKREETKVDSPAKP